MQTVYCVSKKKGAPQEVFTVPRIPETWMEIWKPEVADVTAITHGCLVQSEIL